MNDALAMIRQKEILNASQPASTDVVLPSTPTTQKRTVPHGNLDGEKSAFSCVPYKHSSRAA
jgi:hypothetical protein